MSSNKNINKKGSRLTLKLAVFSTKMLLEPGDNNVLLVNY
jgi:hypothetical protein